MPPREILITYNSPDKVFIRADLLFSTGTPLEAAQRSLREEQHNQTNDT